MGQQMNTDVVDLFKEVYGDHNDLLPDDGHLARCMPFSEKGKVGDSYQEAVTLTNESGFTLSSTTDAFELNPARAGTVKQASVTPYISVLPSIVPWGIISRSAGAGAKAFFDATKYVVKNNLASHQRLLEILRLYGRSSDLLGRVSFAPSGTVYRGATYSGDGNVTLTLKDGSTLAFSDGINAAGKNILFAPGQFAAGCWVGWEGVKVNQVDSAGAIVASGSLVSVNAPLGYITVDFTPVAATSTTSHRLCFDGMESSKDIVGVHSILKNTGTLFGIDTSKYSLWQGNVVDVNSKKFGMQVFQDGIADMVNRGGMEGDLKIFLNPRSWADVVTAETNLVRHDSSYTPVKFVNGGEGAEYHSQNGKATFYSHRAVKEGDAFALCAPTWTRSGSAEASFKIPGMDQSIIFALENSAGYAFRSFSDQYVFCHRPADNALFQNINDESAT
tara:strand:+ start:8668 stop:10005 length:1338 start_codon:yes stop_codon:yes gene_type:complete